MSTSSNSSGGQLLAVDLDGTLLDAEPRQSGLLSELLAGESGVGPADRGKIWRWKREGATTRIVLHRLGLDGLDAERLGQSWLEAVEDEAWLGRDRLLAGVPEALDCLREDGTRIVILTARRHPERAMAQISSLGLLHWCAAVRVVSPRLAAEEKAAELASGGFCGFVGDTESDARAAELAGVRFAAVTTGQRSRAFLESRGLEAFDSLPSAVARLQPALQDR